MRGLSDWALGEPTALESTTGWLQRRAAEALLALGHDPHVLEEIRFGAHVAVYAIIAPPLSMRLIFLRAPRLDPAIKKMKK